MEKQGKVVSVLSPNEVVVNLGRVDGVRDDAQFLVFVLGEELTDPDTQESLGPLERVRGKGAAKHVQPHMTTVRSTERRRVRVDRVRPYAPTRIDRMLSSFPRDSEVVTEEVEEAAPFEDVKVGDLVRVV